MSVIESYEVINKIGVASILHKGTNIKVTTLVPNPEIQFASISSYLGARYSRSSSDVKSILKDIEAKQIDSDKRLGTILSYGHASVADMAEVPIYIEDVPMYMAFKLFYIIPNLAGQERSTRYQDFTKLNVYFDDSKKVAHVKEAYLKYIQNSLDRVDEVYNESIRTFTELYEPTTKDEIAAIKARSFDVARAFIPMGVNTSLMITTSVRNWANCISQLLSSPSSLNTQVGALLLNLLKGTQTLKEQGYIPQAPELVKYVSSSKKPLEQVLAEHPSSEPFQYLLNSRDKYKGIHTSATGAMLEHRMSKLGYIVSGYHSFYESLAQFNRHNQAGNILQQGAYNIKDVIDLGSLRDVNRHRSLERFIPYLHDVYLSTLSTSISFAPFRYLQNIQLDQRYDLVVEEALYEFSAFKREINEDSELDDYSKQLLIKLSFVLGMSVYYELGGSIDDWQYFCDLRRRPGGHIEYRLLAQDIAKKIVYHDNCFEGLFANQTKVNALSKEQFYDRS